MSQPHPEHGAASCLDAPGKPELVGREVAEGEEAADGRCGIARLICPREQDFCEEKRQEIPDGAHARDACGHDVWPGAACAVEAGNGPARQKLADAASVPGYDQAAQRHEGEQDDAGGCIGEQQGFGVFLDVVAVEAGAWLAEPSAHDEEERHVKRVAESDDGPRHAIFRGVAHHDGKQGDALCDVEVANALFGLCRCLCHVFPLSHQSLLQRHSIRVLAGSEMNCMEGSSKDWCMAEAMRVVS